MDIDVVVLGYMELDGHFIGLKEFPFDKLQFSPCWCAAGKTDRHMVPAPANRGDHAQPDEAARYLHHGVPLVVVDAELFLGPFRLDQVRKELLTIQWLHANLGG